MNYEERKENRKHGKKVRINVIKGVTATIITLMIFGIVMVLINIGKLYIEKRNLTKENNLLQTEKEAKIEELENVNTDEYIEEKAREMLKMIKPGEKLYIIEGENEQNQN